MAVLFTSISGLGGIIMVGSIVLPIMMTAGVPRKIAANLFLMSFALGYIFNITNWTFYTTFFGVTQEHLMRYAALLAVIDAIALFAYASAAFYRSRNYATWAVAARPTRAALAFRPSRCSRRCCRWCSTTFEIEAAPAFLIAAVFAVLVTQPRLAIERLVAAAIRGVEDVAPAIVLFMGIGMLLVATKQPQFGEALRPLIAGNWLRNPVGLRCALRVLQSARAVSRPAQPVRRRHRNLYDLAHEHVLPAIVLVAAVMAVVQVQNVCDPTNTANVWIANFTGVPIASITRRLLAVPSRGRDRCNGGDRRQFPGALRQTDVYLVLLRRRCGGTLSRILRALAGAQRVDVDDDGGKLNRVAADALPARWQRRRCGRCACTPIRMSPTARASRMPPMCTLRSRSFISLEGDDVDAGLRLQDCGGWIVDEWHDHEIVPAWTSSAARASWRYRASRD